MSKRLIGERFCTKTHQRELVDRSFSTYGGETKELFKTTNGSWWIVSSNLIQRLE